jgi:E3 ubiquitin-protein ligase HUWE1
MYEDGYDDEMDYDDGAPGAEEDGVSDEDEEIEGMGPIEGLDGDHGVDVEVIMEDDDEDDDEMDSSGADDDDEDEDDDHDSEDDDGRVEIIDEVGNIQQLAADEEIGEWVSDDGGEDEVGDEGEEEDYDDEIAGQEDDMHAMDMAGGPIGHLVRALAGDAEAAEIIERLEAEGIDPGEEDEEEQMQGEYAEDDEEGMCHFCELK